MRAVRPSLRVIAATLLPLLLATCTQDTLGPVGRPGMAQLPLALQAPNVAQYAGLSITSVRATVSKVNPITDQRKTLLVQTAPFAPDVNSIQLSLTLVLTQPEDTVDVTVEYLSGTLVVFSGTQSVIVHQGAAGNNPDVTVPVIYVGPGATIATLAVLPQDSVVTAGGTLQFRVTALDGQQANVPAFYVAWSSTSPANVIDADGVLHAGPGRSTFYVRAVTPTGIKDSSRVTIIPAPATLTKFSGDGQTAQASSTLPLPLIVEVRGADNLPVRGVAVAFAVATGGGQVDTATVITASNGRAGTTVKLGPTAPSQSFTATVAGIGPVTFTATATPIGPATYTWTGTVSTDWFTAGNWSPAKVPATADDAIVPNTTNKPTIGTNTSLTNLTVQAGAVVTLTNASVNLSGALNLSGTLTSASGSVSVAGAITTQAGSALTVSGLAVGSTLSVAGTYTVGSTVFIATGALIPPLPYQSLSVSGTASLTGRTTVTSGAIVLGAGRLALAGHTLVTGLLQIGQASGETALLVMTNALDSVLTTNLTFQGGDESASLTAGVIRVTGNFNQNNLNSAAAFAASGTHKVVLAGTTPQAVRMTQPGTTQSHFNTLDLSAATGGVSLITNVLVQGQLVSLPTGATPVLSGTGVTLTAAGANVTALTLDTIPLVVGGGTIAQFSGVSFTHTPVTATALTINDPGTASPYTFNSLSFGTTPTTGFYLRANDTDGSAPNVLTVNITGGTPATPGGLVQTAGGAVINWPPAPPALAWGGGADNSWQNAANWSPAQVPTASNDVTIPSGTVNAPTLFGNAAVHNLTIGTGVNIDLIGNTLTVNGTLANSGNFHGAGSVVLAGSGTLQGGFENLVISAPTTQTAATTITGNLTINGAVGSSLDVAGFSATMTGNFSVQGAGKLIMTNPAGSLTVSGSAIFDGSSEAGFLTAGTLSVLGNFSQAATSSGESFSASGTHRTTLSGASPTVVFATPGSLTNQSRFQNLYWTGSGTLTQNSGITITGTLTTTASAGATFKAVNSGGRYLQFADNLASGPLVFDDIRVIVNQTGTGTAFTLNNATFQGLASTVTQLTVQHPGTAAPIVLNNLVFSVTPTGAGRYLSATDNAADANVLTLSITGSTPAIGAPFITLAGGAVVDWGNGLPTTWVGGTSAVWTLAGNWNPVIVPTGTTDVVIPAGTTFSPVLTTSAAVQNLTVAAGATLAQTSGILTINGDIDVQGSVTVDTVNANFRPSGTARTIRGNVQQIDVRGSYTASGPLNVAYSLFVQGTPTGGNLEVAAQTVIIGRDLIMQSLGTVSMIDPAGVMTVARNARFTGGSTAGKLTAGRMDLAGNLTQDNSGCACAGSNPSFSPSGAHTTRLTGTATQTIDIFNTGLGTTLSHFNNLDLSLKTGSANLTRLNTAFVAGTLISNPSAAAPALTTSNGARLQAGNVNVNGLVLNALPLTISAGTITAFNKVTLQGYATTDIQLTVTGPGAATPFVFDQLTFSTTPTGAGRYLVANDTLADANVLTINLTAPTPATPGAFTTVTGNAVIGWPPVAPTFSWVGATSNWNTASNWSTGSVPGPTDKVVINPATASPQITTNETAGDITVNAGATLTLTGTGTLTVNGNLVSNGTVTGAAPTVIGMSGIGTTIAGTIGAPVQIAAPVSTAAALVLTGINTLTVGAGGVFSLTGHSVTVPRFETVGTGTVVMSTALDSLKVAQAAIFDGGDETGLLTVGVLVVGDSFVQSGTNSAASFAASSNHKTLFNGAGGSIGFGNPGPSGFRDLDVAPTGGIVQLASNVFVAGNFRRLNATGTLALDTLVLSVQGNATSAGPMTATNGGLALGGAGSLMTGNFAGVLITLSNNRVMTGATTADILGISGGSLDLNGQRLTVNTLLTNGTGTLNMTSASDTIVVTGGATFMGGSTAGKLTAGALKLGGDLLQGPTGSPDAFAPSGTFAVILDGAAGQQVHFTNPGPTTSHFHNLVIANPSAGGVTVDTAYVLGSAGFAAGLPQAQRVIHGSGAGSRIVLSDLNISQTTFDNLVVRTPSDGSGIIAKFDSVTFSNTAVTDTALWITHPGAATPFTFSHVIFQVTPTTGLYMIADDADDSPPFLTINLSAATPTNGAPLFFGRNGAVINWPAVLPATWLGTTSNTWENGANWSSGVVPTSIDPVTIPAGTPTSPVIATGDAVGSLVVNSGATLDIGPSGALTVLGSITVAGTITGTPSSEVTLTGSGTVSGNFDALRLFAPANYSLSGNVTTTRNFLIAAGATVTPNSHTIRTPVFTNAGTVFMGAALDSIVTTGDQLWDGADETGKLTAGTVVVGGNFSQGSTLSANSYGASGGHTTVFNPTGRRTVTFATGSNASSQFQNLVVTGAAATDTVVLASDAWANGNLSVAGPGAIDLGGHTLRVFGDLTTAGTGAIAMNNPADQLNATNATLTSSVPFAPVLGGLGLQGNLTSSGAPMNPGPSHITAFFGAGVQKISFANPAVEHLAQLQVSNGAVQLLTAVHATGSVLVAGSGALQLNTHALSTDVDFSTIGSGTVIMVSPADSLEVTGNASFDGGDEFNKLTAGKLVLRGNLQQLATTSTGSFRAIGSHETIFAGSGDQSAVFASWGQSSLQNAIINKTGGTMSFSPGGEADGFTSVISPTTVTSDNQYITNAMKVAVGATVNFPALLLPSGDSLQVLGDLTAVQTHFQSFQGTGGGTIPVSANIHYTNIISDGGFVAPGLTIPGSLTSESGDVIFNGTAVIGGNLIAGTGSFNLNGQTVLVGGNFQTTADGHLTMVTPGDSLNVAGDVLFAGGDESGKLTAGTLVVGGNFQQSAISTVNSFNAKGTHRTAFASPTGAPQNAFFDSPGSGAAGSHFQDLDVTNAIGGINLNVNSNADGALIASGGGGRINGNGATLTVHQLLVNEFIADNLTIALDEQTVLLEQFDFVTFQNMPTTGALAISVSGAGGNRNIVFAQINFPQLPVGAGNLYVKLVSTNGQSFQLNMQNSNQGGGTGAVLSDPPGETIVNGAQVIWTAT